MSEHEGTPVWGHESESDRLLCARLQDEYETAHEVRALKEGFIQRRLSPADYVIVQEYAEAKAKEILARRALERCGWAP